jgi:hypothetical protein
MGIKIRILSIKSGFLVKVDDAQIGYSEVRINILAGDVSTLELVRAERDKDGDVVIDNGVEGRAVLLHTRRYKILSWSVESGEIPAMIFLCERVQ